MRTITIVHIKIIHNINLVIRIFAIIFRLISILDKVVHIFLTLGIFATFLPCMHQKKCFVIWITFFFLLCRTVSTSIRISCGTVQIYSISSTRDRMSKRMHFSKWEKGFPVLSSFRFCCRILVPHIWMNKWTVGWWRKENSSSILFFIMHAYIFVVCIQKIHLAKWGKSVKQQTSTVDAMWQANTHTHTHARPLFYLYLLLF